MKKTQKTFMAKPQEIERKTYVVDATDKILGRLATKIATVLRGKHKPIYTPHVDTGDNVIIINAEKIRVTGNKLQQKMYQRYSGFPSGQTSVKLSTMLEKKPEKVLQLAVERMMPKGKLGDQMKKKLKIYAGGDHPHAAQKPIAFEF